MREKPVLIEVRRESRLKKDRTLLFTAWQPPGQTLDFSNIVTSLYHPYRVTWTGFGPRGGRHLLRTVLSYA